MGSKLDPQAVRFHAAVALGVAVAVTAIASRRDRPPSAHAQPSAGTELEPWCAPGLEPIVGGGCFAAPRAGRRPFPLLVYLHGRYSPEAVDGELERQARVARMGTERGYAVLALRGRQGQCTDPALASWWCWPSNERNASDGPAFVSRWTPAIEEAERRGGRGRRVLLGFSNGGYFASLIASRALLPIDAVAIAHAGPVEPMAPNGAPPPALLINADEDPSDPEMQRLAADLGRERWPFLMIERGGGHALPDWDVAMALTFFDRIARERLPFEPPLAPVHVREDAGAPPSSADADASAAASASAPAAASASAAASAPAAASASASPSAAASASDPPPSPGSAGSAAPPLPSD